MSNKKLRAVIISTVSEQLNKNNPPETRKALKRMMENDPDCDYDEAVRRIAVVLTEEIYDLLKEKKMFDLEKYTRKLKDLK